MQANTCSAETCSLSPEYKVLPLLASKRMSIWPWFDPFNISHILLTSLLPKNTPVCWYILPGYILNCPAMFGCPPNITGSITTGHGLSPYSAAPENISGAIDYNDLEGQSAAGNAGDPTYRQGFTFDASRCSSEYVSDAKLQVPSLQALVCIKFWYTLIPEAQKVEV